jgi:hypothetical protein
MSITTSILTEPSLSDRLLDQCKKQEVFMRWQQARDQFPSQWLLVEAIKAHTEGNKRVVEDLAVVNSFPDSRSALRCYVDFHEQTP